MSNKETHKKLSTRKNVTFFFWDWCVAHTEKIRSFFKSNFGQVLNLKIWYANVESSQSFRKCLIFFSVCSWLQKKQGVHFSTSVCFYLKQTFKNDLLNNFCENLEKVLRKASVLESFAVKSRLDNKCFFKDFLEIFITSIQWNICEQQFPPIKAFKKSYKYIPRFLQIKGGPGMT